ncbi:MAG: HAD hydrolase-like protein [Thermomicrobiales bacterium]|nr:HAD hydrolase-like protein [Thermomicrobiales bacterium]
MTDSGFPYDLMIFDLDGTLTDSHLGITRSVQHALSHVGIAVENLADLTHFIGPPLRDSFVETYGFNDDQVITATRVYRERYGAVGWLENEVFPLTSCLLQAASASGATLAVASTKGEHHVQRILQHFGLDHHFAVMGGASPDHGVYTKADVIARVMRDLPAPMNPRRTIMIGDREHDVFGARHHGIATISVRYGYARPGELEAAGPFAIADSMEDLAGILGLSLPPAECAKPG